MRRGTLREPLAAFVVLVILVAVVFLWLYWDTKGNLPPSDW
jgi:hypothetical protein